MPTYILRQASDWCNEEWKAETFAWKKKFYQKANINLTEETSLYPLKSSVTNILTDTWADLKYRLRPWVGWVEAPGEAGHGH